MSNHLAVATVTAALARLLQAGARDVVDDTDVTIGPPKDPSTNSTSPEINVYLYQVTPNSALRNAGLPTRSSDGSVVRRPQAALDLYYLLSFYGVQEYAVDSGQVPERLLGHVVRTLHDQAILTQDDIMDTKADPDFSYLAGSDLDEQVEKVKFTPLSLDLEELSKLWSVLLQVKYALSVVYQASVVLIEKDRPVRSSLRVLTRGPDDEGVIVQPNLTIPVPTPPPVPTLETVEFPNGQLRAILGDTLTIRGHHLEADTMELVFENEGQEVQNVRSPDSRTATTITVTLPDNQPETWPVGVYTVSAVLNPESGSPVTTNKLSFLLAPKMTNLPIDDAYRVADPDPGFESHVNLAVECIPHIRPGQSVSLRLWGYRDFEADAFPDPTDSLNFEIKEPRLGTFVAQLRVDGIDSLLVDRSETPPEFDETQKVTIADAPP
jgi:hypothetical protein